MKPLVYLVAKLWTKCCHELFPTRARNTDTAAKYRNEFFTCSWANPRNIVQNTLCGSLSLERTVIAHRKAMRLVTNPLQEFDDMIVFWQCHEYIVLRGLYTWIRAISDEIFDIF